MADQQWIQEMANAVNAAELRTQQDEVATQPATTPRTLHPPVHEWPVARVRQPPPPPRAERPDYHQQPAREWREAIPYVVNYGPYIVYGHQCEEEHQRDANTARYAHWIGRSSSSVVKKQNENGMSMKQKLPVGKLE